MEEIDYYYFLISIQKGIDYEDFCQMYDISILKLNPMYKFAIEKGHVSMSNKTVFLTDLGKETLTNLRLGNNIKGSSIFIIPDKRDQIKSVSLDYIYLPKNR